ncbi:GcrA cell cycle regulator, partial [Roseomonas eburnea]
QRLAPAPAPRPVASPAPQPVAAAAPVVRSFPAARPRFGTRACCWPIGEPGTSGFRFCGGEPMAGKPYCMEHAALAYVKPRDRREDAA